MNNSFLKYINGAIYMLQHTDYGNFRIFQQNTVNYLVWVVLSRFVLFLFSFSFSRSPSSTLFFQRNRRSFIYFYAVLRFFSNKVLCTSRICLSFWYLVSRYNIICRLPQINNTLLPHSKRVPKVCGTAKTIRQIVLNYAFSCKIKLSCAASVKTNGTPFAACVT